MCTGLCKFPQSGGTDTHYIGHYRCWLKWGQSFSLLESQFLSINYCYFHFVRISFHLLWADLLTLWCTVKQIRFGLRRMHGRPTNQLHPRCSSSSRWPAPKSALGHCTATNAKPDSVTVARSRAFYSTNAHHSQSSHGSRDLEPVNQGVHCGAAALASPGSLPGMQSLGSPPQTGQVRTCILSRLPGSMCTSSDECSSSRWEGEKRGLSWSQTETRCGTPGH